MGGADRVVRQRELGKLTVRERLDLLLDPGSWVEYGLLADHMDAGLGDRYLAADGAITGIGEIDGRPVAVAAYDFTVMAGSMGGVGENKIARLRAHALTQRMPFVWLLDSAGARIQSTSGSTFAGAGALFREQVAMSGVVPMVAAMLGHCAAGTAYIPGARRLRADGEGHVVDGARRASPREGRGRRRRHRGGDGRLGRAHQDLRRAPISRSPTTPSACRSCAKYLSFFPQHNGEPAPIAPTERSGRPAGRGALRHRADRAPARVRHAQGRDRDRRRRRRALDEARMGEEPRDRARAHRRPTGRHRRQPADGARRRARRERGRQGRALRVAVRRVQRPARVPARRARASSSAARSRSRASSATAPRCCSR